MLRWKKDLAEEGFLWYGPSRRFDPVAGRTRVSLSRRSGSLVGGGGQGGGRARRRGRHERGVRADWVVGERDTDGLAALPGRRVAGVPTESTTEQSVEACSGREKSVDQPIR